MCFNIVKEEMPANRFALTSGILQGVRPRSGAKELTYLDLNVFGGPYQRQERVNPGAGRMDPIPRPLTTLPSAGQENPLRRVLQCKQNPDNVTVSKPVRKDKTEYMQPPSGIARHQRPALAYLVEKPIGPEVPLAPIASNFYAALNSTLGQPRP